VLIKALNNGKKNQETKRLEMERQAEIKRQQELELKRAEQELRRTSPKMSFGKFR